MRQLLLEELHGVCEELARNANDASDGSDIGGEDARRTYRQRICVVADLLDCMLLRFAESLPPRPALIRSGEET